MSAPKRELILTPRARRDAEEIVLYTAETWGTDQAVQYGQELDRTFELLLSHPYIGRAYDDLVPDMRGRIIGQHIVYYRVTDNAIEVFRILNERVDPARHL